MESPTVRKVLSDLENKLSGLFMDLDRKAIPDDLFKISQAVSAQLEESSVQVAEGTF